MKASTNSSMFKFINEGYDKISKKFDKLNTVISKFNELIRNMSNSSERTDYLKSFSYIIMSVGDLKDNFKDFYVGLNEKLEGINNHNLNQNNSSNFISIKGLNSSESYDNSKSGTVSLTPTLTPKLNSSYDKIFNEFLKVEKATKDIINIKKECKGTRKDRVRRLEVKLQGLMEEAKNFNFLTTDTTNLSLLTCEDYSNTIRNTNQNILIKNESPSINVDSNNLLINQILNMNTSKGEEMIKFIESLLQNEEEAIYDYDTVRQSNK